MIPFQVTILGAGSAIPSLMRSASAQVVQYNGLNILIDCAEGTQLQLKKFKISPMRIDAILISHLHGDHYFGLIGLISTLHLIGRKHPLHIYGPPELYEILKLQLKAAATDLNYALHFKALTPNVKDHFFSGKYLDFFSFPVKHRIPAWGFLICEKTPERNVLPWFIDKYKPDYATIRSVKAGQDYVSDEGQRIPNHDITIAGRSARSYAYCTDTAYDENLAGIIKNVDLLYHEATFMAHLEETANSTFHSTSRQAAAIAVKANVRKLIIGHFSSRYTDAQPLVDEAREVFSETYAATDGSRFSIE